MAEVLGNFSTSSNLINLIILRPSFPNYTVSQYQSNVNAFPRVTNCDSNYTSISSFKSMSWKFYNTFCCLFAKYLVFIPIKYKYIPKWNMFHFFFSFSPSLYLFLWLKGEYHHHSCQICYCDCLPFSFHSPNFVNKYSALVDYLLNIF